MRSGLENPTKYKAAFSFPPHIPTFEGKLNTSLTLSRYSRGMKFNPNLTGTITKTLF